MGVQTAFRAYADVITKFSRIHWAPHARADTFTLSVGRFSWAGKHHLLKEHHRIYVFNQYSILSGVLPASLIGNLSKDIFARRTSTGSKAFSLLTCLADIKFVLHSFFTLIATIWLKIWAKPPLKNVKNPLPVDVRCPKTPLLKVPND